MFSRRCLKNVHGFQIFVILCFIIVASPVVAKNLISGRYVTINNNTAELLIKIDNPAPNSLIIQQFFPPGLEVLSTSPKANGINQKKGKAKWFFKNPRSGNLHIRLTFRQDISKSSLHAAIRCRHPKSGQFIDIQVYP